MQSDNSSYGDAMGSTTNKIDGSVGGLAQKQIDIEKAKQANQ